MNPNSKSYEDNKYIQKESSHQSTIIPNDSLWGEKIKNYQKTNRNILYFNKNDFPKIFTQDQINGTEEKFNPILQKYSDPKVDQSVKENAKQKRLNSISHGYDKQLEVESTYNIINLTNRLKHFNFEEPSMKTLPNKSANKEKIDSNVFDLEEINKKPYNIISNLSLQKHNFLSPGLRPKNSDYLLKHCKEGLSELDKKEKTMETNRYKRDFNILNNEYRLFNKEKKETDREIQNLYAMKKMLNRKTYDILNCKYVNPNLESEFLKNYEKQKNIKLSKTKDKNFIIRNPINNIVYDEEGQRKLDEIEKGKKRRFVLHDNVENYYHSVGNNIETNKTEMTLSHGNPLDLNYKTKRGYDIITGNDFDQNNISKKNDININQKKSGQYFDNWEKIKIKSDENNTITKKSIYKGPYDTSDIDKNFEKYFQKRKITLMNNNNINRSYGTFHKESADILNKNYSINKNPYSVADYINKTNVGNFRNNNNLGIMNDMNNRIDNKIQYNSMDKDKFFGYSLSTIK